MKKPNPFLPIALIGATSLGVAHGALVVSFDFDEGSGTTAVDSSGSSLDGTISGGATWVPGVVGSAISLDGVDDLVTFDSTTFNGMSTTISISAWVYGGPDNPEVSTFFYGVNSANGRQAQIHLPWENDIVYWRAPGTQIGYNASATPGDYQGQWNHWVFTKDSVTGTIEMFLNGTSVVSAGDTSTFSIANAVLGNQTAGGRPYQGFVDEFKVYDHVLTSTEIAALGAVPEPSSALLLLGGLAFGLGRRRRA